MSVEPVPAYFAWLVGRPAQADWRPVWSDCIRAAMDIAVPGHATELGGVRPSMNNATVTMASPTAGAVLGHILRCHRSLHGPAATRSVAGIASWPASLVKMANIVPRPG